MDKAIKITKEVLGIGIFLIMSYSLIKILLRYGISSDIWDFRDYHLFAVSSVSVSGLSMLYALKKLL